MSLASISIMSVGIIITLSATATMYSNVQSMAENVLPREYQINSNVPLNENNYKDVSKALAERVRNTESANAHISDEFVGYNIIAATIKKGNSLKEYNGSGGVPSYVMVYDLDSYNARTHQNIKLKDDEILVCANMKRLLDMDSLKIGGRKFKVRKIENIVPSNYAAEVYGVIAKDFSTMQYISRSIRTWNMKKSKMEDSIINCNADWNVKGISDKVYTKELNKLKQEKEYEVAVKSEYLKSVYELNGGFLFLGVIIGLIFLTGTILVIYYKQVSEGYEDREKYQIMKKIGLSDELIKKTGASQIVWMFFAPLAVAIIHSVVASKIVYQLLGLFGVNSFVQYGTFFGIVIAMFFAVYFVIFKFTSRRYYKIVH